MVSEHRNGGAFQITMAFFEDGQINVQAQGDPYPLGIYNETGWVLDDLLRGAREAIVQVHNGRRDV